MRWRRLLSPARDLGVLVLAGEHLRPGLSAWITLAAGITLAAVITAVMASAAATHSKAVNTEDRVNSLVTDVGAIKSQAGTTSTFTESVGNLSQTSTGSPQAGGATIQTGNPNGATISGSSVAAHTHGYGHLHFTQVAGDYNNFVTQFNNLVAQLNQMRDALRTAGLL